MHLRAQQFDETIMHAGVDINAFHCRTQLSAMRCLRCHDGARRRFKIGIGFDDRGRLAAEFQRRLRYVRLAIIEHDAPGAHAAGQRNHAHCRMRADRARGGVVHREHVENARGQARLKRCFGDLECGSRRVIARPHDDRIAGDQRGRDLAQQGIHRGS